MRFREVRELADEQVSSLISDGMSVEDAERQAIEWARERHGVHLRVVDDASVELPYTKLEGRVLWPCVDSPASLDDETILEQCELAAIRRAGSYRAEFTDAVCDAFQECLIVRLATRAGVSFDKAMEYVTSPLARKVLAG